MAGFVCYQGRMNTVIDLFGDLWNALGCIGELLGYLSPRKTPSPLSEYGLR